MRRHEAGWTAALVATLAITAGCAGSTSRSAVVATQLQSPTTTGPSASWIESASISYVPSRTTPTSPSTAANVSPASYSAAGAAADATPPGVVQADVESAAESPVRVLALRYPHPDGRQDVARVELLTADLAQQRKRKASWLSRVEQTLSSALPGVEWGPGIRQAKGLDLPISDLQAMLVAVEQNRAQSGDNSAPWPSQGQIEVNGRRETVAYAAKPALDELADRVEREGKAISYHGSAADLLTSVGQVVPPAADATTTAATTAAAN